MAESRFQKRLRFWPMVAVMYVLLCGGPYGIEEVVPQSGPTLAVFGMIFMALFWGLPNILQTAEIASALPLQGGAYRWYKESWGGFWGFQFGWLEWLSWMFEAALYPTLVAIYCVNFFLPEAGIYTTWCITMFIGVNHINLSFLGNLNIPANTTTLEALTMALIFGLWNFSGYAGLAAAAEEIEDTSTNYPKALLITLIISLVMYVVPLIIGISIDQNWSNWDEAQFNSVALVLGGGAFSWWFMFAAQSSNFGLINSEMIVLSRLIQAMAKDGFLPKELDKLHHKYETPVYSLVMQGILLSIMTFGMGFVDLLVVGTWLSIPTYLIGFAVFISLRIQKPDMDRPFKIKGGWPVIIPIVAIPCFIALFIFINTPKEYLLETIPLLLSGFAVYFIQKIFSK